MKARTLLVLRMMAEATEEADQLMFWSRTLKMSRKSVAWEFKHLAMAGYVNCRYAEDDNGVKRTLYSLSRKGRKAVTG